MEETILYLKENVRYYRFILKISQQELAERCNVSTTYIGEIELGRKYPSLRTLIKLAHVLEIPVYMLLVNPQNARNEAVEQFSKDLEKRLISMINDMRNRY